MKTEKTYYIAKMFSIEHEKYFYLYANNPYQNTSFIADRFETYEECSARMEEFFEWNLNEKEFDKDKSKVCKITFVEEECE